MVIALGELFAELSGDRLDYAVEVSHDAIRDGMVAVDPRLDADEIAARAVFAALSYAEGLRPYQRVPG